MHIRKLLMVVLLGLLFYYLSVKLLFYYSEPKIGHRISWGISEYYGYFVFFATLIGVSFSRLLGNKLLHLIISVVAFTGFLFYWKSGYASYPNRTLFVLLVGLSICIVTYLITRKLKYEK
jgi:hypothetical protein